MTSRWAPWERPTPVSAVEFVDAAGVLLDAAVEATVQASSLPRADVRCALIDGLAQSLSTDGPLAVIRLDTRAQNLGARPDLQRQAELANRLILDRVDRLPDSGAPGDDRFVSHCVGYVWTPPVAELLVGPTGTHVARNHYNEWLWQVVALRDALIPFARPGVARVVADATGLRRLEPTRDRFVYELASRRVTFAALFAHVAAIAGADGSPPADAYGVSRDGTAVLPAFLVQRDLSASPWAFDVLDPSPRAADGYLIAAEATTSEVLDAPSALAQVTVVDVDGRFVASGDGLALEVGFDDHRWHVDAGAIVTGHRRALRPLGPRAGDASSNEISGCHVLRADTAVHSGGEPLVVPTGGQWPLVAALLGRITPGHAVLWRGEDVSSLAPATTHDAGLVLVDLRG